MTKLDEVIETVLRAREDGPDALAAVALSFGAAMELGTLGNTALKARLAEARDAMAEADEMVAALRHERDAALAECKATRESVADTAEVWRLRESVVALRADIARVSAERDESRAALATAGKVAAQAVAEREAFGLRLSAAERQRDEARARVEAIAVERNAIISELSQATDAMMAARAERDEARARPTYEARETMPTPEERAAHQRHGARWLRATPHHVSITHLHRTESVERLDGATWVPLGADGLPCAWPVVAAEVTP